MFLNPNGHLGLDPPLHVMHKRGWRCLAVGSSLSSSISRTLPKLAVALGAAAP